MSKGPRKNKYVFTLSGVSTEKVDSKYNIGIVSNLMSNDIPSTNVTKLSDLNIDIKNPESISFVDESKKNRSCSISMIDMSSGTSTDILRYSCFWCRHSFDTKPIGCPIKYVSNRAIKSYFSQLSKEIYTIKEPLSKSSQNTLESITPDIPNDTQIKIAVNNYYVTDGIFCSFNCCKAYILDNKNNSLYSLSQILLNKLYCELTGLKTFSIDAAPHWRMLNEYGGNMSISQFRKTFNKTDYESHGSVKMYPLQHLYEEKIKF